MRSIQLITEFKTFLLFFISCFLIGVSANAQINWVYNFKVAQSLAIQQNKLIVVDFWAPWCSPCLKLDDDVWSNSKINEIKDEFIFLKIDIDTDKFIANRFRASQIPVIKIMDFSGHVFYETLGYHNLNYYNTLFNRFKVDLHSLNRLLTFQLNGRMSGEAYFRLGKSYSDIGIQFTNRTVRYNLFNKSNSQYRMAIEKSKDPIVIQKAELYLMRNEAYKGKSKKLLKKIENYKLKGENDELLRIKNELISLVKID